jgi:hypothetical protein
MAGKPGIAGKLCSVTSRFLRLRLLHMTTSSVNYKCSQRTISVRPARRCSVSDSARKPRGRRPCTQHGRRVGREHDRMRSHNPPRKKDSDCWHGKRRFDARFSRRIARSTVAPPQKEVTIV